MPGVVERMLVKEGAVVSQGTPVATLRSTSLAADQAAIAGEMAAAERQAGVAASNGDAAEERLHRIRAQALRQELALLDEQVAFTTVRAPVTGTVLTPHLRESIGASLEEGDLLLTLGRTDTLELEFGVDQRDVGRVLPGQEVRLRVDALPQRTFTGVVTSVGQLPRDSSDVVRYPVRAVVANPEVFSGPRCRRMLGC